MPTKPAPVVVTPKEARNIHRTEIATLARDLLVTVISVVGVVPSGQQMRDFIRVTREFYSELDTPTVKPKVKKPVEASDYDDADVSGLED